ncbi:MAG: acyl carrier protein [Terriglobales bacterium]
MTATVFDQIRTMASDLFGVPVDQISAASSAQTLDNWDSIQHLNLVLAVEEKFGLQLSPEEIEQMKSVGDTAKLVESKLQAAPR